MSDVQTGTVTTKVPARLDRLPWSRWHWMIVIGLGTVWILDGLEVTIVGNISGQISKPGSGLDITQSQITGFGAAIYVLGACVGALFFGWLTDRFGRKKLFMITLGTYLVATAMTALSFAPWWFFLFRFLTGFGIGGEYAAINSAIDELIPSRHRGLINIVINGTYWAGAAAGALLTIPATNDLPVNVGWRVCFGLGVVLGVVVLLVRRNVPESPRWLFIHGRDQEAEELVDDIEQRVSQETRSELPEPDPGLSDVAVRQAMMYGYDRAAIAHGLFDDKVPVADGLIVASLKHWYNPNVQKYPYDPAKARAILDAAGWKRRPRRRPQQRRDARFRSRCCSIKARRC